MAMLNWLHVAVLALIAALVVGAIVAIVRAGTRSKRSGDSAPVVSITLTLSALWAAFSLIGAVVVTLSILLQPQVQIAVPVQEYWPVLPDGTVLEGATATRDAGGFTSAGLLVGDLSRGARVTWAIAQGLGWLLPAAIAGLIAVTCFQLLAGRAFAPAVSRMAMVTAVVVAVGGTAAQVLGDIAGSMASSEVFGWSSAVTSEVEGVEDILEAWWPQATFGVELPFWPIAAGLAFAALSAVFRHGAVLQRETEGLV